MRFPFAIGKTMGSIMFCICGNVSFFNLVLKIYFCHYYDRTEQNWQKAKWEREIKGGIGKGPWVGIRTRDSHSATALYVGELPTRLSALIGNGFLVLVSLPIVLHQHVDDILEEVWLFWAEEASCDLVNGLLQLWNTIVVLGCVVSARWKEIMSYTVHTLCECLLFLQILPKVQ